MRNHQHQGPGHLPKDILEPDDDDAPHDDANQGDDEASGGQMIAPITAAELLAMDIKPRELLLPPWLPRKGVTMIFAGRGIGKTYLAISIACAVAAGVSLLRWVAEKPRRVLYVDGEMPLVSLQERLAGTLSGMECDVLESGQLAFLPQDFYRDGLPDLTSPKGQALIKQYAKGYDLVVFDNLSSLVRLAENEADAWQPMQDLVLWLRRQGISTLIVHHAGKGGGQRGTSRREDVMDSVIELKRPANYDTAQGARFEVHLTKTRGFTGADAAPFVATMTTGEKGEIRWAHEDVEADDRTLAKEMFAGGAKAAEVAKDLGVSRATAFRWHKEWKENGANG
jgi:putative DNA primase/helicase